MITEDQKILVKYLREEDEFKAVVKYTKWERQPYASLEKTRGKIIGALVSLSSGVVGWSLCNKKDEGKFSKERAFDIAYIRAIKAEMMTELQRSEWYFDKLPFTIQKSFDAMYIRSQKYFK